MYNKLMIILPKLLGYVWLFTMVVGSFAFLALVCKMFLKIMGVC